MVRPDTGDDTDPRSGSSRGLGPLPPPLPEGTAPDFLLLPCATREVILLISPG
jgi:hypothetical protein